VGLPTTVFPQREPLGGHAAPAIGETMVWRTGLAAASGAKPHWRRLWLWLGRRTKYL